MSVVMNRTRSRSRSPIRRDRVGMDRRRDKRPVDAHSDKMVYLNNLPFDLKWNDLKDIIRQEVGESAYVEFVDDEQGKFKGAAVLDFENRSAAHKAVEVLHRMDVRGRNITAKEIRDPIGFFRKIKNDIGVDFLANRTVLPGRGGNRRREADDEPVDADTYGLSPSFLAKLNIKLPLVNRVFVTNISYSCGVGQLFDIFSMAGKITWIDLQLDNEGKTKGMAVIQYSHPIEAVQAISMLSNQRIFDRTISVKMDRFEKEAERPPGELPTGLRSIGMGLGANGAPLTNVASILPSLNSNTITTPIQQILPTQQQTAPLSTFVPQQLLTNTNPFGSQQTLQNPVQQYAQQPNIQQTYGTNDMASSMSYQQPIQQQQQQQMPYQNQQNNAGGYFQNQSILPTPNAMNGGSQGNYNNPNSFTKMSPQIGSNNYGGVPPVAKSFYDTTSRVILIKNLPLDYTWQIVHDRVQKFGDVENVEMVSPGVAKVRFVRVPDAERTKNTLSGTTVEGRIIAIEYL
uniref:RRM domain-containing protein n=1 Tax=Panagrolaimus sp. JU765 TaxID=591449 RepID=A0AC34QL34_9BILA